MRTLLLSESELHKFIPQAKGQLLEYKSSWGLGGDAPMRATRRLSRGRALHCCPEAVKIER